MEINYEAIRTRIKRLRKANGFTQESLAEAAGISVDGLQSIERGVRQPSLQTLLNICGVFGITIDELLAGNQPAARDEYVASINSIMSGCMPYEKQVLYDIICAVHPVIKSYRTTLGIEGDD